FPKGQGTMAAVIGLNQEQIEEELAKITEEIVDLANINSPGQIVISGSKKGIDQAKLFPNDQTKYFTLKEYNKAKENRALSRYKIALDELKRKEAKFVEPEKGFATELQRELAITDFVKKELEKIQEIQQDLFTEDIQDPFGQDHAVYQVTYEELKNEINKLINNKQ